MDPIRVLITNKNLSGKKPGPDQTLSVFNDRILFRPKCRIRNCDVSVEPGATTCVDLYTHANLNKKVNFDVFK